MHGPILFSEGTYSVEIEEDGDFFSPFIQIDDEGRLLDSFCSCSQTEGKCSHILAALKQISPESSAPLHVRFRKSFWKVIATIASARHADLIEKEKNHFVGTSLLGEILFEVKSSDPDFFEGILYNKKIETESNSLKFSNLPEHELALWKQGKPSLAFRFELSFWSDLAKKLFLMESEAVITFENSAFLPKKVYITFPTVSLSLVLCKPNWEWLVPTIDKINSTIKIYPFGREEVKSIRFDKKECRFFCEKVANSAWDESAPRIEVGDWFFLPGRGFFSKERELVFQEGVLSDLDIPYLLAHYPERVEAALGGEKIFSGRVPLKYALSIDASGTLSVCSYLFEKGDLEHSPLFFEWVYIEKKGFFRVEEHPFSALYFKISKEMMDGFISERRIWLSQFEGFMIHLSHVESHFTYHLTPAGVLVFETMAERGGEEEGLIDYNNWVYIRDKGFFSKASTQKGGLLTRRVGPERIESFIQSSQEELEPVKGFFAESCSLLRTGLEIQLNMEEEIIVRPRYIFEEGKKGRIFGSYVYVENEGFSVIPSHKLLPKEYEKEKKIVAEADVLYFLTHEVQKLSPQILSIDPRLVIAGEVWLQVGSIVSNDRGKRGEWQIRFDYKTASGKVSAYEVFQALKAKKNFLYSEAGFFSLKAPRFNWLLSTNEKKWKKETGEIATSLLDWIRLSVFEDIRAPRKSEPGAEEILMQLESLQKLKSPGPIDLSGLKSELRSYQISGVDWLWSLYCNGLSALLADEMGLGKTHQAMALLAGVRNSFKKKGSGRFLVICPTSVLYHWEDLLIRFLPELKFTVFYGARRTLDRFEEEGELLLTSYGTLRSESKELSKIRFDLVIFDEIQIAKNIQSQTHKALVGLQKASAVGLSGTPIENRLMELKALFDIILPGYMPSERIYKEFFANPIERDHNEEKRQLLIRMVKPFILRRKKEEVLKELPEKTEEIAQCPLSPIQEKLYTEVLESSRTKLLEELEDSSKPTPYVHVFALLSALKRICNHPALHHKDLGNYKQWQSGKWELFIELLNETRESGRKLVVFSQYLGMLDIIRSYLDEEGIGYATLQGDTANRREPVKRFASDPKCEVFVASLQAAGVGIDLVAASVVIHFDRWWNPAKENQATDRVHRIGQTRGVQVFKFVTKGTIEEHIDALITKKLELAQKVVGYDDEEAVKTLDRQELIELLKMADLKSNK